MPSARKADTLRAESESRVKKISVLPTLLTLANFFLGLLAISKGIDALALIDEGGDGALFHRKLETACMLIFAGMVCDALDGKVARLTDSMSDFGKQLDSFADALTFGVAPAFLVKILVEGEARLSGSGGPPRLAFVATAFFATMAILRLARFNLETDNEAASHQEFYGLPSPGAAGAAASTVWLYLILRRPDLESVEGTATPLGHVIGWIQGVDLQPMIAWVPFYLLFLLPALGLLMISRVRYVHVASRLTSGARHFFTLVKFVVVGFLFYLAPVPLVFCTFNGFVIYGLSTTLTARSRSAASERVLGSEAR